MDTHTPQTNPADLVRQLNPVSIRERLDALDRERQALLVLLRAALRTRPDTPAARTTDD